jgi:inner membrane protein
MKFPLMSKALAMGGVVLGLMWSLGAVQDVVHEREARRGDAERSVVNSLAGTQTLLGPVLLRHCTETWQQESGRGADKTVSTEQRDIELALAPSTLKGTTSVGLEPRHRGLFKVNGYAAKAQVDVAWSDLSALVPKALHANGVLACDAPVMSVGVSDGRGIRLARLMAKGQELAVKSGTQHAAHAQGFHAALPPALVAALDAGKASEGFAGQLVLELAGTKGLSISPVADRSEVTMNSGWPHPSFGGRFLPSEREVRPDGFSATWRVTSLATTAQRDFYKGGALCPHGDDNAQRTMQARRYQSIDSAAVDEPAPAAPTPNCVEGFGVDFVDVVNPYVLSDRATKYGLLFIALTFVGVILVEVLNRLRVHPIQYLLVGLALTIFFLLLVSLSEHMAFGAAYAIAAVACTSLLAFYASHILGGWVRGLVFGGGTAMLYGTLYALLQMEQSSLVLGSILLFVVLAIVMVLTRRMDWYALTAQMRGMNLDDFIEPEPASHASSAEEVAPAR